MEQVATRKWSKMWYALPVLGAAIPAAVVFARRAAVVEEEPGKDRRLVEESNLSLNQALNTALKLVPGTPIEIELEEEDGCPVWEVEIVPKKGGPTRDIRIDGITGDLLAMKTGSAERC